MSTDATTRALVTGSIDLVAENQAASGAYVAAPGYHTYAYSWLRDGSFIAASMDAHRRTDSASAFHRWVAHTVARYAHKVERLEAEVERAVAGTGDPLRPLDDRYTLHTRFTVDGHEAGEHWGDFQLDGYGFWLTSVVRHLALTGREPDALLRRAVDLVRRYLVLMWQLPCFDCWEEYPTRRHMATWAAIEQGLRAIGSLGFESTPTVDEIQRRIEDQLGSPPTLRKFAADDGAHAEPSPGPSDPTAAAVAGHERVGRPLDADAIDGSALLVLGDFGPFEPTSDVVRHTLRAIEDALVVDGGVYRYLEDEYYGGGLWVVLAGALATAIAPHDADRASDVLAWIESQADASGDLPEQVTTRLLSPATMASWVERWGPPARPLLWSHAMYLLGVAAVRRGA